MLNGSDLDQVAGRLRDISRDGGSIEAAQVKVIGLDEIREAAGPRWPRMRERVRSGSLSILSQHTGPADVVIPAGDGFLVILADGPPGQTQRRCQEMRDALVAFYLGEEALQSLRAEVTGRSLSADGLTDLIASSMSGAAAAEAQQQQPQRVVAKSVGAEMALVRVYATHEKRVGAMLCAPMLGHGRARRIGYNPDFILDGRHAQSGDFLELDIALLDEALARVETARAAGQPCAVGLYVHATTMQIRKSREAYLSWLDDIHPDLRRHFFVVIAEIEKGTPLISISEWSASLRPYSSRVWLDFHYADHAIASISGAGAWAAGFHLPVFAAAQQGPRAQRMYDQLRFWSRSLRGQNMRVFVNGFVDQAFLAEAGRMGVDFATSDVLWPFEYSSAREALAAAPIAPPRAAASGAHA